MREFLETFDVDTLFGVRGWFEVARVRSSTGSTSFYLVATPWFCFSLGEP